MTQPINFHEFYIILVKIKQNKPPKHEIMLLKFSSLFPNL